MAYKTDEQLRGGPISGAQMPQIQAQQGGGPAIPGPAQPSELEKAAKGKIDQLGNKGFDMAKDKVKGIWDSATNPGANIGEHVFTGPMGPAPVAEAVAPAAEAVTAAAAPAAETAIATAAPAAAAETAGLGAMMGGAGAAVAGAAPWLAAGYLGGKALNFWARGTANAQNTFTPEDPYGYAKGTFKVPTPRQAAPLATNMPATMQPQQMMSPLGPPQQGVKPPMKVKRKGGSQ